MTVFISHRKIDEEKALALQEYLSERGISAYIDALDPNLRSATDITKAIISQLNRCSHLLALFTNNTRGSYWVPFELGAAYEADKGIATFIWDTPSPELPGYLDAFPRLEDTYELDEFVKEIKSRATLHEYAQHSVFKKEASAQYADSFISGLKNRIRQR